jgi:hypothetical protein
LSVRGEDGFIRGTYPIVREENALEGDAFGEGYGVFVLADFIALDVLDGVEKLACPVCADGSVAHCEDVVSPACTGHYGRALGPVDSIRDTEEGINPDVICCGCDGDERVAERHGEDGFTLGKTDPPVVSLRPSLVRAVEYDGWGVVLWRAREKGAVIVQAGLVIEECVGEVKVTMELVVVEFHRDSVV